MGIHPSSLRVARVAIVLQVMVAACGSSRGALVESDAGSSDPPSDGAGAALSCAVEAPSACPDPAPHFADDGPWPLTTYQDIADWHDIVKNSILSCSMPPEDAGVRMTNEERLAILVWIRCALPQ